MLGVEEVRRHRLIPAFALLLLLAVAPPATTAGAPRKERRFGAVVTPVRLRAPVDRVNLVRGLHSYFGTIELDAAGDGIVVSNTLPLERYLWGLNEVPSDWPEEALKAQAVAARTYALFTLAQPPGGEAAIYGFDICASVQCQVFSGADVAAGLSGSRWVAAVRATEGQAVLYDGAPILARYHSTSGGRTLDNPQAFPEEGSYPYLVSVPSPWEEASPLYRWATSFPVGRLERILRRGGLWRSELGRLRRARSVPSTEGFHYPDILMSGTRGRARATAEEVRVVLRELAPAMFPSAYPGPAPTGSGRLPEVLPANRVTVWTKRRIVRVVGRGWGHGVGMSQWGAFGLAQEGFAFDRILRQYYFDTELGRVDTSQPVEVGVATAQRRVTVTGEFELVDGRGRVLAKRALGEWSFGWAGPGVITVDPPAGHGLPLRVGIVRSPDRVEVGDSAHITVALSKPARVAVETSSSPTAVRDPGARVEHAGRQRLVWYAPLEPGVFSVRVKAVSGDQVRYSERIEIEAFSRASPDEETAATEEPEDRPDALPTWAIAVLVATGAVVLIGLAMALSRRGREGGGR